MGIELLIGIISDIHANLMALEAVLDSLNDHNIDELWCTGDIVGYYTFPEECLQLLTIDYNALMIKGNHGQSVATGIIPDYLSYKAAISLYWTSQTLNKEYRRLIYSLPTMVKLTRSQKTILLIHGGFEYPLDEYLSYKKSDLDNYIKFMEFLGIDYLFLGHTHIPFIYSSQTKTIVTSGSVGQPRDGDTRSCYTLFDTQSGEISFHRVEYKIEPVIKGIYSHKLPKQLAYRLYQGE